MTVQTKSKAFQRYRRSMKRFLWFVMSCCLSLLLSQPWFPLLKLSIHEIDQFIVLGESKAIAATPTAQAPTTKPEPRVKVEEVVVQGVTGELQDIAYKTLTLKPGGITTRAELQTEINNLFATGWFSNVQAEPKDTPKGVRVTFVVKANPVLKQVSLKAGDDRKSVVPETVVNDIFRSQYNKTLNYKTLQSGVIKLREWYRSQGYVIANIADTPQVTEDGRVILKVDEGIIESIRVSFKDSKDEVLKEGKTPPALILSAVNLKPGMILQQSQLLSDIQRIFGLGIFKDVKINLEPGTKPEQVIVVFSVVENNGKPESLVGTAEAATKAEADLQRARQQKDPIAEAKALRVLAGIQSDIEKYKTALKLSQGANDRFGEAEAHRGLALMYYKNLKSDDKDDIKKEKRTQAIASYQNALKIYQELKNDQLTAIVLRNMGFLYQELEDYGAAIDVYEKALPLLENLKRPFWQALTLSNLASSYREFKDPDKSLIAHQEASLLLQNLSKNPGQLGTTSLVSKDEGTIGSNLSNFGASFSYSKTLGTQGEVSFYTGTDSLKQESLFDVQKLAAITLINIGGGYQAVGDYQQALYAFKAAFPRLKLSSGEIAMLIKIGRVDSQQYGDMANEILDAVEAFFMSRFYSEIGERNVAKQYFDRFFTEGSRLSERIFKVQELGNKSDFMGLTPIVTSFFSIFVSSLDNDHSKETTNEIIYGWVKSSIPFVQKMLDKNPANKAQFQPYISAAEILENYLSGDVLAKNNQHQQAIEAYQKVLAQWKTIPWEKLSSIPLKINENTPSSTIGTVADLVDQLQEVYHAKVHTGLSTSLLALGKSQEALAVQQKALQILEIYNSKKPADRPKSSSVLTAFTAKLPDTAMAEAWSQLGKSYAANQQDDLALQSLNRSLPLWKKLDETLKEADVEWEMAIVQRKQGNLTQAKTQIETAIDRIESEKAQLEQQKKQGDQKKIAKSTAYKSYLKLAEYLASKHNYYAFYIDLLMDLHQQSPSSGYEELAFQASERSRARSLRAMLNGSNQKTNAMASDKPQAIQLAQPLSLKDIQQQLLDDKTLLLEYALGQDKSYLWAVTKTGLKTYILPKQADIEIAARQLIGLLKSRDYQFGDREALQEVANSGDIDVATYLSKMLLGQVANQLENKRLLIVADGILHYLPFAALPKPGKETTPLLIDHEIIGLPSASMGAGFQRRRTSPKTFSKEVLILADPIFTRDDDRLQNRNTDDIEKLYKRLEGTREEATKIAAFSPGKNLIKLDGEASRQLVMNTDLNPYRIVHLATHGILNGQNPARSGMILSTVDSQGELQRSLLSTADVFNLKLSSDLVVLSGCTTALGKEIQGEGLIGMTGGLMYSGSQQVAAGLWDVDDDGTALLMTQFYQGMLKQGLSPAAALRSAQINLLKSQNWKAPYYWSAFTLQGQ
jgi:CHAT domain-containing protein